MKKLQYYIRIGFYPLFILRTQIVLQIFVKARYYFPKIKSGFDDIDIIVSISSFSDVC